MIIDLLLPLSLIFIMFTLGIGLTIDDFKNIFNYPKAFTLGIISQILTLPIIAFLILLFANLSGEMAVGIMILSCCPGGVTSNIITKLAKGDTALSISLTALTSILSVFSLPLIVSYSIQYYLGSNAPTINILSLSLTMFIITTFPVGLGLYINTKYNKLTNKYINIANKISSILFIIIVIGALLSEWNLFINNIYLLAPTLISLITIMLFYGYRSALFIGLQKKQAITIAIESGIQNATVGITIGSIILNQSTGLSAFSLPSGVYGILMYLISIPIIFYFINDNNK